MTSYIGLQLCDRLVFDLANSFPGQAEFFTNVFKAHWMINADAEEKADHFFLPFCQSG